MRKKTEAKLRELVSEYYVNQQIKEQLAQAVNHDRTQYEAEMMRKKTETVNHDRTQYEAEVGEEASEDSAPLNKRAQLLRDAEEIINGSRAQTYGPPDISFNRIADIWNGMGLRMVDPVKLNPETEPHIHGHKTFYKAEKVTATDVALILIGMKLSRTVGAVDHEDNWLDIAGYAGLGAELADEKDN